MAIFKNKLSLSNQPHLTTEQLSFSEAEEQASMSGMYSAFSSTNGSQTAFVSQPSHDTFINIANSTLLAPATPTIPDLAVGSDSGNNSDNITFRSKLQLQGKAEANALIHLYVDGTEITGGATKILSDSTGNWSFTDSSDSVFSSSRSYQVKTITEVAGVQSKESPSLTITVDRVVPQISAADLHAKSDSGASGVDNITNSSSLLLQATGDANYLNFYEDLGGGKYSLIKEAVRDANGVWSAQVNTGAVLTEGTHQIVARASDIAGNLSSLSSPLSITIDRTAPAAPSIPQLDPNSQLPGNSNATSSSQPYFIGKAEAGSKISLIDSDTGAVLQYNTAKADGSWQAQSSALSVGIHHVSVSATDIAGNVSKIAGPIEITVLSPTPNAPSTPTLNAKSDSGYIGDNLTNIQQPLLDLKGTPGMLVRVFDASNGNVEVGSALAAANGAVQVSSNTKLSDGTHILYAVTEDTYKHQSTKSDSLSLKIDTHAPQITLIAPSLINSHQTIFKGSAEPNMDLKIFTGNEHTFQGLAHVDNNGSWSLAVSKLAEGLISNIVAEGSDAAGNWASSPATKMVVDTIAPNVSLNVPRYTNSHDVTATGKAEAFGAVSLYWGANHTFLGNTVADAGGNWAFTQKAVVDGTYDNVMAQQTDQAGNIGTSNLGIVTVDTVAPIVSLNLPRYTNSHDVTASGKAEANGTVSLYWGNAHTFIGNTVADSNGNWTFTQKGVGDGTYENLVAQQTDQAGNTGVSNLGTVTVDTTAPQLTLVAPALTNSHFVTAYGHGDANGTVNLYWGNAHSQIGSANTDANGNWNFSVNVGDGTYDNVVAEQVDLAGNKGVSNAVNVTVDTTAPAVSFTGGTQFYSHNVTLVGFGEPGQVQLFLNYDTARSPIGSASVNGGVWYLPINDVSNGSYNVTVIESDAAGNVGRADMTATVSAAGIMSLAPHNDQHSVELTGVYHEHVHPQMVLPLI